MKPSLIFRQYVWIVNTLRRYGRMTLEELSQKWIDDDMANGNPLARSTFNRHRDAVLDMFGVIIDCDVQGGYKYFIANPKVLQTDSIARWMLNTLTVGGILVDSVSVKDRILLESVPAGEEFLQTIIKAMKSGHKLEVSYRRFGQQETTTILSPYTLKLFRQRWYLLADNGKYLSTYALDRMISLTELAATFDLPEDFSAQEFFADYFGIVTKEEQMEHIIVRTYGTTADYLRTLPLHASQQELQGTSDEYTDFSLDLRPTYDFLQLLLSHGGNIEVLQPESLRRQLREHIVQAAERYK
ncbi:MAG: WYL domain-containing protein [Alloprevotella sp.]|nr:WYL domain-containing protein [Alloprevotella sp.]